MESEEVVAEVRPLFRPIRAEEEAKGQGKTFLKELWDSYKAQDFKEDSLSLILKVYKYDVLAGSESESIILDKIDPLTLEKSSQDIQLYQRYAPFAAILSEAYPGQDLDLLLLRDMFCDFIKMFEKTDNLCGTHMMNLPLTVKKEHLMLNAVLGEFFTLP